jgi:Tol biopolymer transport system component
MRYDGSGKKMLTRPEHNSQVPRWSPDGRFIAFTRMTEDRSDIFIMDTSGNSVRQITTPMNIPAWNELIFGLPDWSRDGEKIICTVSRIGRIEDETSLAIISLVSSDFVVLSSLDSLQPVYPRWSPARDEIAFVGRAPNDTKGPQIYRANIGGQNLKQLSDAFLAREPDWSWDGEWIIYSRLGKSIQDPPELWVMNRDGTHHRKLLGDSVNAYVYGNW